MVWKWINVFAKKDSNLFVTLFLHKYWELLRIKNEFYETNFSFTTSLVLIKQLV